jgi:hypothetical protein
MKLTCAPRLFFASLNLFAVIAMPLSARASNVEWTRRLVSNGDDHGTGVAADGLGNVYITGSTGGSLAAPFAGGYYDGFVSKYDASGNLHWTHQLGTDGWDEATGVIADGLGNVYVAGHTGGVLGEASVASFDSFVSKFDADGILHWTRQFGTSTSRFGSQYTRGIAADGLGNLYVTGNTPADANYSSWDVFVTKLDISGNLLWTRQIGTGLDDSSDAIAADSLGNTYITGSTYGSLGGPHAGNEIIADAFLSKFDAAGDLLWSRQLGGIWHDYGFGAVTDDLGNVYIAGATNSDLGGPYAGGFHDAYVAKYDVDGNLVWIRQDGSFGADEAYGIAIDDNGGLYISGNIDGIVEVPSLGFGNTFVTKYDLDGNLQWTQHIGEGSGRAISVDQLGAIFVTGGSSKRAELPSMDWGDAFLTKIANVPEPSSAVLAAIGITIGLATRRRS